MPYQPPSGWVEKIAPASDLRAEIRRFHTRRDCPMIDHRDTLRAADKPYSIRRCPGCARA